MNEKELTALVTALSGRVEFLERLLRVDGEWLSVSQATQIMPFGKDRIWREITIAEEARAAGKPSDLQYGVHYYSTLFPFEHVPGQGLVESPTKAKNTWMVHGRQFWEVLRQPIEKRRFHA